MRAAAPGKKTAALQQKNVELKTKKNKQKAPGSGEGSSTSDAPQPPRKKRARVDPTVESEETFLNRVEVKVKIPEELKPWLVDDWDLITRQKQLFNLPAKKNVETILEEYATYKKSRGNTDNKEYAVNEVVAGIKEYFNVMLGTQLLYKFERPQYADILADHPDAPMSQVYGAPHLLRLFVRIGAMLSYTPLDEKSLALLLNYLHDFLNLADYHFLRDGVCHWDLEYERRVSWKIQAEICKITLSPTGQQDFPHPAVFLKTRETIGNIYIVYILKHARQLIYASCMPLYMYVTAICL
ncbi:mortality factor 4-like protein 1 isoform X4 [Dendrobates tinctorius]